MKKEIITLTMALAGIFFWGCEKQEELTPATVSATGEANSGTTTCCPDPEKINFDQYRRGSISQVNAESGLGPIGVYGINPDPLAAISGNAAMIFDTDNPTGGDDDLVDPLNADNNKVEVGKVLIVTENLNEPDDTDFAGAKLILDFSRVCLVSVCSLDIIDLQSDEGESGKVEFFNAAGTEIHEAPLPTPGENRIATANFGLVEGVAKMEITLNGSAAIDNIIFCVKDREPPADRGCTRTQGYWKTHSKYGPAPHDRTWNSIGEDTDYFLSDQSYYQVINTSSAGGNAYYTLARQYIAAVLNRFTGASAPTNVINAITEAAGLFNTYTPEQIGALKGSDPLRQNFLRLAKILDDYNNGLTGPGHCDENGQER